MTEENEEQPQENLIWGSTLDDKYSVKVVRLAPYTGELQIWEGDTLLTKKSVGLSYGALYGVDPMDENDWQEFAMEFVDKRNEVGSHDRGIEGNGSRK